MYVYSCGDTERKIGSMREIGAKGRSAFVQMNLSELLIDSVCLQGSLFLPRSIDNRSRSQDIRQGGEGGDPNLNKKNCVSFFSYFMALPHVMSIFIYLSNLSSAKLHLML
jgi:hypothetical protein